MTMRTLKIEDARRDGQEVPTDERLAKAPHRVVEDAEGNRRVLMADDTPLGRMALDKRLSPRQYEAGIQFRVMHDRANGQPLKAASMEPSIRGGSHDYSDRVIAAKQQLLLIRASLGEELNAVLIAVCAHDETPSGWARARNRHPSIGCFALETALTQLADRLGLEKD